MSIGDANLAGLVHGGVVMKMCDEVAGVAAIRHCGRRIVTAGMDRMTFVEPVSVGELLSCQATVNAAWRTSMEVGVRVEAENPRTGVRRHTSTAYLTMVALDDQGRPTPVPPLGSPKATTSAADSARPSSAAPTDSPSATRSSPSATKGDLRPGSYTPSRY